MSISAAHKIAARRDDVRKGAAVDADLEDCAVITHSCILKLHVKQVGKCDLSSAARNGKYRRDQERFANNRNVRRKRVVW